MYITVRFLIADIAKTFEDKWPSSRKTCPFGFPTKQISNQSPQLQRLARKFKFHL